MKKDNKNQKYNINIVDKTFAYNVMQEMGLEEGERRRLIDQDTGEICCLGNKDIVVPGSQSGKNAIEFDPNNPKMMNKLFMEFLDKLAEEEEIDPCVSYGIYNTRDGMNTGRVMFNNGEIIESKKYKNESLCYIDLVHRINGNTDVDLSKYDNGGYKK